MMLSNEEAEELVTLLKGGPLPPADLERALTIAQKLQGGTKMPPGAEITEMDACDLVGRLVVNSHGTEFIVTKLTFEARSGSVVIWVMEIDDDRTPSGEAGLIDLAGWSIHQKLRKEDLEP